MRPSTLLALAVISLLSAAPALAQTASEPRPPPSSETPATAAPAPEQTPPAPDPAADAPKPEDKSQATPEAAREAKAEAGPVKPGEPWYRVRPVLEAGFLAVLAHGLQFGKTGTYWNLPREGGQDNLYFVWRASVEAELERRHVLIFLYQPLQIDSAVQLKRDLVVDDTTFATGTPMRLSYGFPFYRVSYMYDFFDDDKRELAIGVSVQLRNATINYVAGDGSVLKSYRDVGVVPLIKARGRYNFENGLFAGFELDGIYAPISVLNGSDNEVVGSLLDASVRVGMKLPYKTEAFLNVRYLGGGAVGQSDPEPFQDGYTKNWLHFLTVSLGASFSSF